MTKIRKIYTYIKDSYKNIQLDIPVRKIYLIDFIGILFNIIFFTFVISMATSFLFPVENLDKIKFGLETSLALFFYIYYIIRQITFEFSMKASFGMLKMKCMYKEEGIKLLLLLLSKWILVITLVPLIFNFIWVFILGRTPLEFLFLNIKKI